MLYSCSRFRTGRNPAEGNSLHAVLHSVFLCNFCISGWSIPSPSGKSWGGVFLCFTFLNAAGIEKAGYCNSSQWERNSGTAGMEMRARILSSVFQPVLAAGGKIFRKISGHSGQLRLAARFQDDSRTYQAAAAGDRRNGLKRLRSAGSGKAAR